MSAGGCVCKVDAPIIVGPVERIGRSAFRVAADPGDAGDCHVVDAVSEHVCAMDIARGALCCNSSLHRGDG